MNLSQGQVTPIVRNHTLTSPQGDQYEALVTIGAIAEASAGNYRDNITLTVITTD